MQNEEKTSFCLPSTRWLKEQKENSSAYFSTKYSQYRRYSTMLAEKQRLSVADIEAQSAFELPDREMMLVTVVITNLLNNLDIEVNVNNNKIAVQVCAIVEAI